MPTLLPLSLRPLAAAALLCAGGAQAQETFKIAYIDPLSGPFANVGELMLNHIQFAVEDINAKGGVNKVPLQLLQFDSKLSAQESQSALQAAIDQGARAIITGGSGSSVVTALVQSAARHNQRNPGKEVMVLNHSSIDPELTGKACNFWHFMFDANTAMRMKAISDYIKTEPSIQKVYLLNQDYAHGKQWAAYGRSMVGAARPDIQFVGETLHPIGKVKDFAPYVSKVKASGADTIISGNWGQDMALLLKAAGDAGLDYRYFNHSAGGVPGTVLAVSQAGKGQLTWVAEWHPGQANRPAADAQAKAYKAKMGKDFLSPRIDITVRFLAAAIQKSQSTDPLKVATAMENMVLDTSIGKVRMRGQDHQLLLPQVVNTIAPVDGKRVTAGWEGTQWGFRTDAVIPAEQLTLDSACQMKRPERL
ncbi:branched-chain amino acid ABC transporter substrate-binding protein [Acidovorax sp. Be4]|uniref:Branched-chain amino acid ABC transporter substrate-binding protein n=1 Tax=Acidovorax bellezanensis TaxID=2976702 RepID=A0ABT2PJZ4_9BURK|nr:branched-chain amino acid ABC transporter substrate-binding protein [Acidovorax sp. Be4]MCT9810528.1 branched-chain amino acid ABC transporter substrate-binding protein [Acidovorax sp. Be4]